MPEKEPSVFSSKVLFEQELPRGVCWLRMLIGVWFCLQPGACLSDNPPRKDLFLALTATLPSQSTCFRIPNFSVSSDRRLLHVASKQNYLLPEKCLFSRTGKENGSKFWICFSFPFCIFPILQNELVLFARQNDKLYVYIKLPQLCFRSLALAFEVMLGFCARGITLTVTSIPNFWVTPFRLLDLGPFLRSFL